MIKNLLNLFFPEVCKACSQVLVDNEHIICTSCRHNLPVTNFHFEDEEFVKKVLYGRVKLQNATALLHFQKKGITQQLIHNLKYRNQEQVGSFLGKWLGNELKTINAYKSVDVVIPVPLHKSKMRKRGYNQVAKFAQEIAVALNTTYNDTILIKEKSAETQVFKKRIARWTSVSEVFTITNTQTLIGKHILIVDDIITTGATMEACAKELQKIPNITLSVAAMAIA